jgi:hypothetical protein
MAFYPWQIAIIIELLHLTTFFLIISNKNRGFCIRCLYRALPLFYFLKFPVTDSSRIRIGDTVLWFDKPHRHNIILTCAKIY